MSNVPHVLDARVVVYVRQDCHLCDVALSLVVDVCEPQAISWTTVDIDTDPQLLEAFTDHVPVTFVDGEQHDYWGVNPGRLSEALGI
ncbi:MAG: glutaredoxin family protein [Actinomycetales bacterium]|nr:glutaredoxin family protein [Actinomycetales bacterium]